MKGNQSNGARRTPIDFFILIARLIQRGDAQKEKKNRKRIVDIHDITILTFVLPFPLTTHNCTQPRRVLRPIIQYTIGVFAIASCPTRFLIAESFNQRCIGKTRYAEAQGPSNQYSVSTTAANSHLSIEQCSEFGSTLGANRDWRSRTRVFHFRRVGYSNEGGGGCE